MDTTKKLERIMKGASNHWRIKMLYFLDRQPQTTVWGMAKALEGNFKTIAEHLRRLAAAGLVTKRYREKSVIHELTPVGKSVLRFLRILE